MPSYYAPGARKGNAAYVVRGRIDGRPYEITTDTVHKRGKGGAEVYWERFKREVQERNRLSAAGQPDRSFTAAANALRRFRNLSLRDDRLITKLERVRIAVGDDRGAPTVVFGTLDVAAITLDHIARAGAVLYPKALPQTRNRQAYTMAATVLHYAAEELKWCGWTRIRKEREVDRPVEVVRPEDLDPLVAEARAWDRPDLVTLIETIRWQGWRITETLMLRRDRHEPDKCRVLRWVTKSRKWKWTALDPDVNRLLAEMPKRDDGYIFPWRTRHEVYDEIEPLLERVGIRWTPHMSRRGFATALIERGESDDKSIAEAGAWEDVKSVQRYKHIDLRQAARTIAKLRPAKPDKKIA